MTNVGHKEKFVFKRKACNEHNYTEDYVNMLHVSPFSKKFKYDISPLVPHGPISSPVVTKSIEPSLLKSIGIVILNAEQLNFVLLESWVILYFEKSIRDWARSEL